MAASIFFKFADVSLIDSAKAILFKSQAFLDHSITRKLLQFSKKYTSFTKVDENISMHSCLSILTNNNSSKWVINDNIMLSSTMESYMETKVCNLFRLFLLKQMREILKLIWQIPQQHINHPTQRL